MSLISRFSFSPRGSRSTKALLSTFGASLVATARGGTSGGGLELCCPSGTRLGGNMLVWKGFPRVVLGVQDPLDPLDTGVVVVHDGRCWVGVEVPKPPEVVPQAGPGGVVKIGAWVKCWEALVVLGKMEEWGWFHRAAPGVETTGGACRDNPS